MFKFPLIASMLAAPILRGAALAIACSPALAVNVSFDTFAGGTAITTQYQMLGAIFSSDGGTAAHILNDPAEAISQPNILVGNTVLSNIFLKFIDPATGLPSTASNISVGAISVGHSEWTVTARNTGGQAIETFVLQHFDGPVNGLAQRDLLTFSSPTIASIDFIFTLTNPSDGIGIDNLSFVTNPVPEPASAILFVTGIVGLLGLGLHRRKLSTNGRPNLA